MARSIPEIEADIADVREAIKQALTMQSYGDGTTRVQRAQLAELQVLKKDLPGKKDIQDFQIMQRNIVLKKQALKSMILISLQLLIWDRD